MNRKKTTLLSLFIFLTIVSLPMVQAGLPSTEETTLLQDNGNDTEFDLEITGGLGYHASVQNRCNTTISGYFNVTIYHFIQPSWTVTNSSVFLPPHESIGFGGNTFFPFWIPARIKATLSVENQTLTKTGFFFLWFVIFTATE